MEFLSRLFGRTAQAGPPDGGHDMVSIVALMPSWELIPVDVVREELDALFPGEYLPPREAGNFVVEGPAEHSSYLVNCTVAHHQGTFLIYNVPGPYGEFSDFLRHIEDAELRAVAAAQPCWMSVDLIDKRSSREDAFRFIGAVLAKLAPPDCTLLVHPSRYMVIPFTSDVRAVLASGGSPFGTS
jgi:hypothetical protein